MQYKFGINGTKDREKNLFTSGQGRISCCKRNAGLRLKVNVGEKQQIRGYLILPLPASSFLQLSLPHGHFPYYFSSFSSKMKQLPSTEIIKVGFEEETSPREVKGSSTFIFLLFCHIQNTCLLRLYLHPAFRDSFLFILAIEA